MTTYLDHHGPLEAATFVDRLVQLPLGIIRVQALRHERLVEVELLRAVVRAEVVLISSAVLASRSHLDKDGVSLRVDPPEGMTAIRREMVAVRSRMVGHQHHAGVL